MQHPEVHSEYHPPAHVAKSLIHQAIRNIPNNQSLLGKLNSTQTGYNRLRGLQPHVYNNSGRLQFAFQN